MENPPPRYARTHPQRYRPAHAHLRMRGLAAAALLDGWQAAMVVHGSPAASTGASQAASSSATSTSSTLKRRYDWNGARHTGHLSSVRWSKQWWQTHRWRHGSRMVSSGLDGQKAAKSATLAAPRRGSRAALRGPSGPRAALKS
eukprot:scaffold111370_cov72-Phaeocystis_antarctica.AAC.1